MSETSSFHTIYETHSQMVYNLALQYLQNREDAEEITQDVFVSIHQNLNTFKGEAEHKTWIYKITINKSLDALRARKRKKRFAFVIDLFSLSEQGKDIVSTFDHPGVLLEQKEEMEVLFKCLNSLPDNQKSAIILSKIEGKSLKEMGVILGISSKAVESLLQRAKKKLSEKLKSNEGNSN